MAAMLPLYEFGARDLQLGSLFTAFISTCSAVIFLSEVVNYKTVLTRNVRDETAFHRFHAACIAWAVVLALHNILLAAWAIALWTQQKWQRVVVSLVRVVAALVLLPATIVIAVICGNGTDVGVPKSQVSDFAVRILPLQGVLLVATFLAQIAPRHARSGVGNGPASPGNGYTPHTPLDYGAITDD